MGNELRRLIRDWRRNAERHRAAERECKEHRDFAEADMNHESAEVYDRCADDLWTALADQRQSERLADRLEIPPVESDVGL